MRILICTVDAPLPPTNTGFRRQLIGLLPELSKRNEVRLVAYLWPDQAPNSINEAEMRLVPYVRPSPVKNAKDLLLAIARQRPLRSDRLVRGLCGPLEEELKRFEPDIVHVGPGKLAGLIKYLGGRPAVLWVMDTWHLNVEARALTATGLRRFLLRGDAKRIRRFEATQYRGWDRVVPSNQEDLETMRALDPTLPMALIPIGFDASAYTPDPAAIPDPTRIMFHGALNYAPNMVCAEFLARRVLPRVRAVRPEAHLVVVGRDPVPSVRALGELEGVQVIENVPDMRPWLSGSRVWAGPFLSGTGIKTKLLEAMAANLPCVVTSLGGRGLDLDSGTFLVGSTEAELAAHILQVLEDNEFAQRLGQAGGAYVRERYDWSVVGQAFERLYGEVLAKRRHATN